MKKLLAVIAICVVGYGVATRQLTHQTLATGPSSSPLEGPDVPRYEVTVQGQGIAVPIQASRAVRCPSDSPPGNRP